MEKFSYTRHVTLLELKMFQNALATSMVGEFKRVIYDQGWKTFNPAYVEILKVHRGIQQ